WIKLQERGRREPPKLQKLLLAEARGTNLEQWAAGFEDGQFQRGGRPLALVAGLEGLAERLGLDRLAEQVAGPLGEVPLPRVPPFLDQRGIGPGEIKIRAHGHVLVFGVFGRPGFEALGLLAFELVVSDVDAGDQAERLASDSG